MLARSRTPPLLADLVQRHGKMVVFRGSSITQLFAFLGFVTFLAFLGVGRSLAGLILAGVSVSSALLWHRLALLVAIDRIVVRNLFRTVVVDMSDPSNRVRADGRWIVVERSEGRSSVRVWGVSGETSSNRGRPLTNVLALDERFPNMKGLLSQLWPESVDFG
ncbi:MAG: hypothetical protein GY701_10035 [Sulfitobacter sp.]|nr:hypothetical protein [Sulfitobacter sp.]